MAAKTRDQNLAIRAFAVELRRWKQAAKADGRKVSDWARTVINNAAKQAIPSRSAKKPPL
jgi:uncharacterized protein (DUF1778 family)